MSPRLLSENSIVFLKLKLKAMGATLPSVLPTARWQALAALVALSTESLTSKLLQLFRLWLRPTFINHEQAALALAQHGQPDQRSLHPGFRLVGRPAIA